MMQVPLIEEDELLSAQDLIDFTPIHRCCQIFNVIVSAVFLRYEIYTYTTLIFNSLIISSFRKLLLFLFLQFAPIIYVVYRILG